MENTYSILGLSPMGWEPGMGCELSRGPQPPFGFGAWTG
jgi:hypothetical protein